MDLDLNATNSESERPLIGLIDLSDQERERLSLPPGVSAFQRRKLEKDAKKSWDLFYKRNGDRFFKRRHWTRREFNELLSTPDNTKDDLAQRYLLEVGCGCGDFALPFLDDEQSDEHSRSSHDKVHLPKDLFIYCCDISSEAIRIIKSKPTYKRYNPSRIKAFEADVTTQSLTSISQNLDGKLMDYVSLIFVLSALDPGNMKQAVSNVSCLLKPGGLVLVRDYGIYDEAMMRFSERSKIDEQFYVRQDGTRAYFFSKEQLVALFEQAHFQCHTICYVERETINNATGNKYSRIFVQAKFRCEKVAHT